MATFWIGIDVSKLKFDVTVIKENQKRTIHKVFNNNSDGFEEFMKFLNSLLQVPLIIGLESTGIYGEALTELIFSKGYAVTVINPSQVKAFSRSEGLRCKTDKVDSGVIARFCQTHKFLRLWKPTPTHMKKLTSLKRCLNNLQNDCQMYQNRIEGTLDEDAQSVWMELIKQLKYQIKDVEEDIKKIIDQNPSLKEDVELLKSIPGVGEVTATTILSELPNVNNFSSAKEVAAFAGLVPCIRQSGTSVNGRKLCKMGNKNLRKALYMPTLVAKRYNPILKSFCENLQQKGKNGKSIVVSGMRKLLHIIYGVLKSKQRFKAN